MFENGFDLKNVCFVNLSFFFNHFEREIRRRRRRRENFCRTFLSTFKLGDRKTAKSSSVIIRDTGHFLYYFIRIEREKRFGIYTYVSCHRDYRWYCRIKELSSARFTGRISGQNTPADMGKSGSTRVFYVLSLYLYKTGPSYLYAR